MSLLPSSVRLEDIPSASVPTAAGRSPPGEGPYCTDMVGCEAERQGRLRLAEQAEAEREGIPLDVPGDP
jgi:hypothetical protein